MTITITVETRVITATGTPIGASCGQDSRSPTPAGINMTGMISIKSFPVSFT